MGSSKPSGNQNHSEVILYSILFLFFFQLISDFVEAIYAFGLLSTSLTVEVVSVLFFFSPVILLLLRRGLSGWPLILVGELVLISRITEVMLDTRGKMIIGGLGIACFMILFPTLLWNQDDERGESSGPILGTGLTIGLSLSILFRVLNSGSDISTYGWFQSIGWILAVVAGVLMVGFLKPGPKTPASRSLPKDKGVSNASTKRDQPANVWKVLGLGLGLTSVFVLLYFAFMSLNVIARWTGASYPLIVSTSLLVLCLFVFLLTSKQHLIAALTPKTVLVWNILFVLSMVLTILSHQIRFPPDPGAYPLPEPPVTLLHHVPLTLMLILFPTILVDFILLVQELVAGKPSIRVLGASFTLASLFLLLMIFAQVFTTVYDYIPVVGPFFRDKFWLVFLTAGIALTIPVRLVSSNSFNLTPALSRLKVRSTFPGVVVLVSLATVAGVFLTAPKPVAQSDQKTTLRILTYNIQQGYSEYGLRNYDGQLEIMREVDADIIGLQECDTNRIAGGNSDVVRYFADKLNLYSYYGPKTVPGTFGIALLSKYPIENPRTFYMYSEGEQTATIEAQIKVGDKTFNLFVTHLGNGGPIIQQEAIIQELRGKENIIAMGDFNFRPDTKQHRLTTGILDDSWLVKWPQGVDSQGVDPSDRIDHIFVSPGTIVADSRYLSSPHSDHPAMTTEIEW
jgi:endonuclease/exonuclease/phosphatase family metal-dependent hydrolase